MLEDKTQKEPSVFQLKKKYKRLFFVKIAGDAYMFRLLTWNEFKLVRSIITVNPMIAGEVYDQVFEECLLNTTVDPDDLGAINGGVADSIARIIMYLSMPTEPDSFNGAMDQVRANRYTLYDQIEYLIINSFNLRIEDLDNLYGFEIMRLLAHAEAKLQGFMPELPLTAKLASEIEREEPPGTTGGKIIESHSEATLDYNRPPGI